MRKLFLKASSSLSRQLFWCILAATILILISGLLVLSNYAIHSAIRVNDAKMEENLQVTADNLGATLNEADYLSYLIFSQNDLLTAITKPYTYPSHTYNLIQHTISRTRISSKSVSDICFCDNWGNLFQTIKTPLSLDQIYTDLDSCKTYLSSVQHYSVDNNEVWYFLQSDPLRSSSTMLVNVREINVGREDQKPLLLMYFPEPQISTVYSFLGSDSFIMTSSGTIISAVNKDLIGTTAEDLLLSQATSSPDVSSFTIDGRTYHSVLCPVINCYLVVPSDLELLTKINHSTMLVTFITLALGILFSTIASKLIATSITTPLVILKKKMEQVQSGDLEVRCYMNRQDEIGYLCNSFNYMMDMLVQYLEQHEQQQELAREKDLMLMQSQINPHLLYNSLDSALCLLNSDHTELTNKVLEELSQFFRLSLQRGNKIVKVCEAVALAEAYLHLQNLCRMKNYHLTVSGDLTVMDEDILHMCLQPIIENAVLHGFEGNYSDGNIQVYLSREGTDVLISIRDDGVGMNEEQLYALRQNLIETSTVVGGYGLWNVVQRIKIHYGEAYGLEINSELGEYTTVTMRIPALPSEIEEDQKYV